VSGAHGAARETGRGVGNGVDPGLLRDGMLRAWLESTGDAVALIDAAGRMVTANAALAVALERPPEALTADCWRKLWPEDERIRANNALDSALRGERAHFRGSTNSSGSVPRYWEVQLLPVEAEGHVAAAVMIARDISQERRNEQRLLEIARRVSESARFETENLRRLLRDAPSIMCVLRGPEFVFELVNEAAQQLAGHRDLLGATAREAFPGHLGDLLIGVLEPVYRTGIPFISSEAPAKLQRVRGGPYEDAFLNIVFQPIREEDGTVSGVFVEATEITARVRAERALADSERRLRLAQEVAGIGSLEVDVATGETRGSEQFWRIWGVEPRPSIHITALEALVVPEDQHLHTTLETRRNGTAATEVEYRIRRADTGELRWLSRHIEFILDANGRPAQMIGVVQDITERKAAEEQRALLSRELEHRMKNTLAMVSAVAAQTLRGDDIGQARGAFMARLEALATANDILMARRWSSAPILEVAEGTLAPHMSGEGRIRITGPTLRLGPRQALALALGLHELATNAAKYGALSTPGGYVTIEWSVREQSAGRLFRLVWRERGGPPVVAPARRGFGSRLIERVVSADFHGTARIEYESEGVSCILEAPLAELAPQSGEA
jgi:PAS domain S-box-containing protein